MVRSALAPIAAVLAVLSGCSDGGSDSASAGGHEPPAPGSAVPVTPEGFERTAARVTAGDGEVCDLCVWIADNSGLRARGLMHVTDLGEADAMAFVYGEPTTASFWMKNTVMPLSIAFFGADGSHLGAFDMAPCTDDPCHSYPTAPDFTVAVEVPQGHLDDFLMLPGSTLELLDLPCEPPVAS